MTIISKNKSLAKLPSDPKLNRGLQATQLKCTNLKKHSLIVIGAALLGMVLTGCMTIGGI